MRLSGSLFSLIHAKGENNLIVFNLIFFKRKAVNYWLTVSVSPGFYLVSVSVHIRLQLAPQALRPLFHPIFLQ
jgi:hypothetical protein